MYIACVQELSTCPLNNKAINISNTPIRARRFCIVKIYMTEPKTAIFASSNMIMLLNDTSKVLSFAY